MTATMLAASKYSVDLVWVLIVVAILVGIAIIFGRFHR